MIGVVDIGGTKLLAACSPDGATVGNVVRRDTKGTGPPVLVEMLRQACGDSAVEAITMSVPGPFVRNPAGLTNPPGMSREWWGADFTEILGNEFGCRVVAENDANCSALAEAVYGAGKGHRNVVYFTVSTGIGTGVVKDGKVYIGRGDTEGGHIVLWPRSKGGPECDCGGYGCLETLASGRAIARRYGRPAATLQDQEAWDEIGMWLGLAVVNTTALLDPDVVVFGGGVTEAWEKFEPALRATVTESLHLRPAPVIARAELRDATNNLVGALLNLAGQS